jgi:hypothetical protein
LATRKESAPAMWLGCRVWGPHGVRDPSGSRDLWQGRSSPLGKRVTV